MNIHHVLHVIPILSPFLFIQSLYASFLKSIGFFYLLVGNVTWTQGVSAHYQCEHTPCLCDPYLVSFPFYTIPIMHLSYDFIYLSLIFIYTQYMFSVLTDAVVWSTQVLKGEEVVIEKSTQDHFWL